MESFLWAFGILRSRTFEPFVGENIALVPGLDLVNHTGYGIALWQRKVGLFGGEASAALVSANAAVNGEQVRPKLLRTSLRIVSSSRTFVAPVCCVLSMLVLQNILHFTGPPVPITARVHSTPQSEYACVARNLFRSSYLFYNGSARFDSPRPTKPTVARTIHIQWSGVHELRRQDQLRAAARLRVRGYQRAVYGGRPPRPPSWWTLTRMYPITTMLLHFTGPPVPIWGYRGGSHDPLVTPS
eukprot:1185955-Prorocentrum_minimum.AAC.1